MSVLYQQLCKIEFKHSYYADNILEAFNLKPTSETQNKMAKGIFPKQVAGTLILYVNQAQPANTPDLYFSLNLQNPHFLTFTAIQLEENNVDKKIEVSGQKKYFFSNASALEGFIPMKKCKLVHNKFEVRFNNPNQSDKKLQISDAEGKLVYEAEIADEKKHLVDISESVLSSGLYQLIFDGQKIEELFVTSDVQEYQGIGILEVDCSKTGDYFIQFESRRVYSRYNLIFSNEQKNAIFTIKTSDGQVVSYEQQKERILPNGQTSIPILLQEKIAFSERPSRTFTLEMETLGNVSSVPLPFASPNSLKRLETSDENEAYVAEMYIYL